MPLRLEACLRDMLRYSQECRSFTEGKPYLAYENDPRLRRAVERSLQIVGEALWQATRIDPLVLRSISNSARIIGLRHRLVHDYKRIVNGIVWSVVQEQLLGLDEEVRNFLLDHATGVDLNGNE